jgi:SAM-dependent methyltransferase
MKTKYDSGLYKLDGKEGKVYIGIPRERVYIPAFVDNRDTVLWHLEKAGRGSGYFQAEGHRVDRNRDKIVEQFLENPQKPEWLVMLDSDMEHPGDAPIRLTRWNKPIVGGLYFHRGELHDPFVFRAADREQDKYGRSVLRWAPMRDEVFDFLEENHVPLRDGAIAIEDTVNSPLVEVDAVATGCIAIHRSVLEVMEKPIFEYREHAYSEDLMFCHIAKNEYGIPIYADMSCISGHYNWVPMGQTQFRVLYRGRGLNLTTYSKSDAVRLLSGYTGESEADALREIEAGSAHMVSPYWQSRKPQTPEEVKAFYEDEYTGKLYLIELLHWNFTSDFDALRRPLMDFRDGNVLEIGAGIGTVSAMLAIQSNEVVAVEPNEYLRKFIEYRWKELVGKMSGRHGNLYLVDDEEWLKAEDEQFGLVVALDVFEHLPKETLRTMLKSIQRVLAVGGTLYYHANFGQQDLYPMHYDHSEEWPHWLEEFGFYQTGPLTAVRVR